MISICRAVKGWIECGDECDITAGLAVNGSCIGRMDQGAFFFGACLQPLKDPYNKHESSDICTVRMLKCPACSAARGLLDHEDCFVRMKLTVFSFLSWSGTCKCRQQAWFRDDETIIEMC